MSGKQQGDRYPTMPVTSSKAKRVMLRGERGDKVSIDGLGEYEIVWRKATYYGPALELQDEENNRYELTAPGRQHDLQLAKFVDGEMECLGEYDCELTEYKQYTICGCGEPIKSAEHDRLAALNIGEHE